MTERKTLSTGLHLRTAGFDVVSSNSRIKPAALCHRTLLIGSVYVHFGLANKC